MTSDTTPSPSEPPTTPNLPIPAGGAEEALREAFDALGKAFLRAEAVAIACGRALDTGGATGGTR